MSAPLLYLIAGEPSGDRLGGSLMRALNAQAPDIRFAGLGGSEMQAAGLDPLFDIRELSVMGLVEVLPRLPAILSRLRRITRDVLDRRPDALITIDSPSFSLRVARAVKRQRPDLPVIHYVAPSVWAWRPGRARRMAAYVDHVLALLPFEPPYMTEARMGCDFVGHPAAERPQPSAEEVAAFRSRIGANGPLLLMAPGSRPGEVRRLVPVFLDVVQRIAVERPGLKVAVPLVETVEHEVRQALAPLGGAAIPIAPQAGEANKRLAMAAADAGLVASGTITIEMAAAGTPMVACYRANALTAAIVRRIIRVETANLVNLVSGSRVVPEFLQERARPDLIAPALLPLLDREAPHAGQVRVMAEVMATLGRGGTPPSTRAAQAVLRVVGHCAGRSG